MHTAVPTSALSGSERASEAQINALSKGAGTAGFNYASSLFKSSPIVGGNFFGTDYYQATAGVFTYNKNATFDYAFGNAPLNITQTNTLPGNLTNYIQLANGKIFTYSDGLLPTSTYFLGGAFDHNWIFALGKNQYNFFSNFASAPSTISFTKLPAPYLHF